MVNGQRMEPLEEVVCEIEDEFSGPIIDALSLRRGEVCITFLHSQDLLIAQSFAFVHSYMLMCTLEFCC